MPVPWIRRRVAAAQLESVKSAWNDALAEGGVVFVEQLTAGAEAHHVSDSITMMLGWRPSLFDRPGTLRSLVHVDDLATWRTLGTHTIGEAPVVRLRHVDGSWRTFRCSVIDRGPNRPLRLTMVDVTADTAATASRRRAHQLVQRSERAVLMVAFADPGDPGSLHVLEMNPAAQATFGCGPAAQLDTILGATSTHLLRSAAFDVACTGESLLFDRMALNEFPDRRHEVAVDRLADGSLAVQLTDVTHRVTIEDHLRHRALHDQLTGMPNLALLEDHLADAGRNGHQLHGLLLVELHGDPVDDDLVAGVGRRLQELAPGSTLVARTAERHLAVFLPPLLDRTDLGRFARSAAVALEQPFDLHGHAVMASATVGGALADHPDQLHDLVRDASRAVREAGSEGRPWKVAETTGPVGARAGVFDRIRQGIADGSLELRYQPVVDLRTGRVAKVEALLRWGGDSTDLSPGVIDLAERSDLVEPLARWVVGEAAGTATALAGTHPELRVCIRLNSLGGTDDIDAFCRLLALDGQAVDGRLEVAVSEQRLTSDPLWAAEFVRRMGSAGVAVVIDEFGAGFSSLGSVGGLGVRGLKIDRSFIATLTSVEADAAVVGSTIELCHQLGLEVTAVGVADPHTLDRLRAMGCDTAQGFLFSEPVAFGALAARIAELEHSNV